MRLSDLAPGLVLGDGVQIGDDVRLGAHVVIHPGTVIGDGCEIQDGAVLGKPPKLARHSSASRDPQPSHIEVEPWIRVLPQCKKHRKPTRPLHIPPKGHIMVAAVSPRFRESCYA